MPSNFLVDGQVSGLGTVHPLLTLSFFSTWILPLHVVSCFQRWRGSRRHPQWMDSKEEEGLHASIVGSKTKQLAGALRCLTSTDWGYEKSILRSTYIVTGGSTVEHAAVAWLPWVSISTIEKLEMYQRYARRAITGQIKATPVEAILAEADLPTVAARATQLSNVAMEKSLRMPDTNPRMQVATAEVHQRTKKTSWRKKASEVWRSIFGSTQPERTPGILHTNWKPRVRGGWSKVR